MAAVAPQPLLAGQMADIDVYRTDYNRELNFPVPLMVNEFFIVKLLEINRAFHRKLYKYDSFIIYMCLEGTCTVTAGGVSVVLTEGNSCLVPASVADIYVEPHNSYGITRLLETYIDNKNY